MESSLDTALRRLGHTAFRPGQREAISTLLSVGRCLLVAPTGGGKSLVYQLPATLFEGTTLVVSPLVALMQDQVDALSSRNVAATYLAATLPPDELGRRMASVARGAYRIVYVAPERLAQRGFQTLVAGLSCPLVAIDEAHCISEWGHDFRPEYLQLGALLAALPGARVLACTATATPVVRDEILSQLGLPPDTPQLVRGFARPNLALRASEVSSAKDRAACVDAVLAECLARPGAGRGAAIVYAPTRRAAQDEAARLAGRGWNAAAYHAGLDGPTRERVTRAFAARELEVVAATNAFGMGIDRADVRAVVHLAPPGSIEAYYQEVGRAGRDGAPAVGSLLFSNADLPQRRRLLERDAEGGTVDPRIVQHKWQLFLELLRFAEGGSCRHDAILRYFADEAETLAGCGHCDVCLRLDADPPVSDALRTEMVRKALSAVARIHGRFGLLAAARLLRGEKDERLQRARLDETATFGALRAHDEEWLVRLLRRCVTAGWVDFEGSDRPVAVLTPSGREVMAGRRPARLEIPTARRLVPHATVGAGSPRVRPGEIGEVLDSRAQQRFDRLRAWRQQRARLDAVPAYVVLHDRTLRELAALRPARVDDLALAHGMGPSKLARYGTEILALLSAADPSP
ncbi:MAG: ATP-dependent DNA helicase RecQ [Deltaproteobacteria bacterium]|nr:ATP-dependent DNA helicase RecQ [Deltaproteobacteria bacterium]